jgi:hypothetical protein
MKKPDAQEGTSDSETQEPRKLNMEEKRKLEKILLSDIDSAVARYDAQAQDMRGNLIDRLTKNPPADARQNSLPNHLIKTSSSWQRQTRLMRLCARTGLPLLTQKRPFGCVSLSDAVGPIASLCAAKNRRPFYRR